MKMIGVSSTKAQNPRPLRGSVKQVLQFEPFITADHWVDAIKAQNVNLKLMLGENRMPKRLKKI